MTCLNTSCIKANDSISFAFSASGYKKYDLKLVHRMDWRVMSWRKGNQLKKTVVEIQENCTKVNSTRTREKGGKIESP